MGMKTANIKKFTRILYLLHKLEGGSINLAVEAKELGFSVRTLERDIQEIDQAGFPVTNMGAGRYSLMEGFSLQKLSLSARDEALLKLLGQLANSLGPQWAGSYQRLLKKTARPAGKEIYFVKMPRMYHNIQPAQLNTLEQAILKHQFINLYYQSAAKRVWCNHIKPLKIALFDGFWYLITLNDVNTYMKFSLGKIIKVLPQKEYFKPLEIAAKLQESPNIWFDTQADLEIKCLVSAAVASYFKEVEFLPHQKIEKQTEGGDLVISCKTANIMQVLPQIKHWLPHIQVLEPASLQNQLNQQLLHYLQGQKK